MPGRSTGASSRAARACSQATAARIPRAKRQPKYVCVAVCIPVMITNRPSAAPSACRPGPSRKRSGRTPAHVAASVAAPSASAATPPPFPGPLRLVHEDEHLIVIDKPPGLLSIADAGERQRTAYRLLRDWVEGQG